MRDYFAAADTQAERQAAGLPVDPTDCELEIIAQTWSEHCKHKEFSALINYKDLATGETKQVDSLFKTYIKDATSEVDRQLRANGNDWLVKVFSDNAGAVRINANIRRNGISVVQQRAVKGPAREIIGNGQRNRRAQAPGQHQGHHNMAYQSAA